MRNLLLAGTALVTFGGQVFAADLPARVPVKAPVAAVVPGFNWTGCYVGAHVGAGWGHANFSDPTGANFAPAGVVFNVAASSALGGGQVGCNYQYAPNWVFGVSGDVSWTDIHGAIRDPFFANKNIESKTQRLASATGQLGYTWDRWMLYGKGGAAWVRDRYDTTNPVQYDFTNTVTRTGWVAGVGVAWAIQQNWLATLEFDRYDFGSGNFTLVDVNLGPQPANIKQQIEVVKFGVNYRFGPFP
jgi:outer membrane immunogenic protein